MLLPGFDVGLILLILGMGCLGSWPNIFRAFPYGVRPELPFFDFTWTGWVVALCLALMFGNTGFEIPDFFNNLYDLRSYPMTIICSLLAGACLAVGNMFYLQGMNVTGQTTAAPVTAGISLVVGMGIIYSFDNITNRVDLLLHYLFPGLLLIFCALVCSAVAQVIKINYQREKDRRAASASNASTSPTSDIPSTQPSVPNGSTHDHPGESATTDANGTAEKSILSEIQLKSEEPDLSFVPMSETYPEDDEPPNLAAEVFMKVLPGPKAQRSQIYAFFICAIGGAILGAWRILSNLALQPGHTTPYTSNFLFFSGAAAGFLVCGPILMMRPFTGRRGKLSDYKNFMGKTQHWQAIVSGFLFAFGVCLVFFAETGVGYPLTFVFSQSAPLLTSLWGIFYWREFDDTPRTCKIWLAWMFVLYLLGLIIVLLSHFLDLSLV